MKETIIVILVCAVIGLVGKANADHQAAQTAQAAAYAQEEASNCAEIKGAIEAGEELIRMGRMDGTTMKIFELNVQTYAGCEK